MSNVFWGGAGGYVPQVPVWAITAPAFATGLLLDASTEKAAMIGRVNTPRNAAKNISKVGFCWGAVTKHANNTTDMRVSLQNMVATTDAPDEVVDQSFLVGNANLVANTWYEGTLDAVRAVTPGELLAVVWEYTTFNTADSITIRSLVPSAILNLPYSNLKVGGSWGALTSNLPNVVFGFDDGSYGTFDGAGIFSAINIHTYGSSSTPDEHALVIDNPVDVVAGGFWVAIDMDGDTDIVLYSGTTPLTGGTMSFDKDNRAVAVGRPLCAPWGAELALTAGGVYYLAVKPTSVTSLACYSVDVANAAYWQAVEGDPDWGYSTRTDGGAWAAKTTTRRLVGGLRLTGWDVGSAGPFGCTMALP